MLRIAYIFGIFSLLCIIPSQSFLVPYHSELLRSTAIPRTLPLPSLVTLNAKSGKKKKKPKSNTICVNRQARRNFEIVDKLEAGISLTGTEVKAIRDGKMNLQDAFVKPSKNGRSCTLVNCHIGKHDMSGAYFQHEERRERPLLLHKEESRKLLKKTETTGMTIVALRAYFNSDNKVKVQIALAKGKNVRDKRNDIKERDSKRETGRIMKNFRM